MASLFKRLFVRRYEPGTVLAVWWGAVCYDHARAVLVCVPIPFNIPARLVYILWLWVHRPWISTADEQAIREHGMWWKKARCTRCGHLHECVGVAQNPRPGTGKEEE